MTDKAVVAVVCTAAVLAAIAISVRWGGLDTTWRAPRANAVAGTFRRLCVLEVSALVSGLLVGGFGSRLMMRVIAATSAPAAQGRITDAEEVVGKVTLDGTIGLLIFVGLIFGMLGAFVYAIVGRYIGRRASTAGLALGLVLLGVFARTDPLSPDNRDFTILSPVPLAIAMIAVLFLLYGTTFAALAARLERAYPPLELKPRSLIAHLPLALLLLPPGPVVLIAAFVVSTVSWRFPDVGRRLTTGPARRIGSALVATAALAANIWLGFGLAQILS